MRDCREAISAARRDDSVGVEMEEVCVLDGMLVGCLEDVE